MLCIRLLVICILCSYFAHILAGSYIYAVLHTIVYVSVCPHNTQAFKLSLLHTLEVHEFVQWRFSEAVDDVVHMPHSFPLGHSSSYLQIYTYIYIGVNLLGSNHQG